jgi:hypothetical protein
MRLAPVALFVAILAALPLQPAKADCSSPLAWPFCIAGAVVNAATTVATTPFYGARGSYAPSYGYYGPYYYRSAYYRHTHYYRHALYHHARYFNRRIAYNRTNHRIAYNNRTIDAIRPVETTRPPEPVAAPTVDDTVVEPPPQRR